VTDSVLDKFTGRKPTSTTELADTDESEAVDDLGCFGWLRGARERAVAVELRRKDGSIRAIGYAWIEQMDFDPSDGIVLHCGGRQIRIRGRNLNAEAKPNLRLFQGLARHRVPWIQEADEPAAMGAAKDATVIESVEW
jgi:hypothetical protein